MNRTRLLISIDILRPLVVVAGMMLSPLLAVADGQGAPGDEIPAPPPTYQGNNVTVVEKLGVRLPLDTKFRRHDGNVVTLGDVLAPPIQAGDLGATGEDTLPTILTFNYADCPMLCSLQLNGLTAVLPQIAERKDGAVFVLGEQFRIVTISLEPGEDLGKLARMRDKYIARLPEQQRDDARRGWTFLAAEHPGDAASIRRVAEAVGFSYVYIKERAEWAHPASLIMLSTRGVITRYVHGIEFAPDVMRESILKAGASEPATAIGFMNRCYHFDPDANNHSRTGVLALRVAAAGFVVLLLSGLGMLHIVRGSKHRRSLSAGKGNPS